MTRMPEATPDQLFQQAWQQCQAGNTADGERLCREALAAQPDHMNAHRLMGAITFRTGRPNETINHLSRILELNPNIGDVHNDLAIVLEAVGRLDEALPHYALTNELCPMNGAYVSNYAAALQSLGRIDDAVALFRRAIEVMPGYSPLYSNLLLALHYEAREPQSLFEEHLRWAQLAEQFPAPASHPNDRNPDRRLRIGYMSADFREHSVSYFVRSFLAAHHHHNFEIFCYDNSRQPDRVTELFKGLADQWRRIAGISDDNIAQQIQKDQIDILVDLAGHSAGNSLLIFARKPAPVQVTYLGYPNTTGTSRIDYRLTDSIADPPGTSERFNSERLVRLDPCAWCYTPPHNAPVVSELPMSSRGYVTFASFNNFAKVSPRTIDLWGNLLQAVPDARLLIKTSGLDHPSARQRVFDRFASHGIDEPRLELLGRTPTTAEHLAVYQRCDIALDAFPYHGTTTTCEALWMGLPVITLLGEMHMSRVSASLLSAAGMEKCIARSDEQYVQIASELSKSVEQLTALRAGMRDRMRGSPLMDSAGFTRRLESAYRQIWLKWTQRA